MFLFTLSIIDETEERNNFLYEHVDRNKKVPVQGTFSFFSLTVCPFFRLYYEPFLFRLPLEFSRSPYHQ